MAVPAKGVDMAGMARLLKNSKTPVNAAIGLSGKDAVMFVDKIKTPVACSKALDEKYPGLQNARWGTAFVDIDADPKLVILTLNKTASGMGAKLRKTLKGTPFSKVRIQLEDGTVTEDPGDEDEELEDGASPDRPGNGEDTGATLAATGEETGVGAEAAGTSGATGEAAAPETGAPEPTTAFDPAALTSRLTQLVKQALPLMAAGANELKALAGAAQKAIKEGDGHGAQQAVQALEDAVMAGAAGAGADRGRGEAADAAPQAPAAAPQGRDQLAAKAAVVQKTGAAWMAVRGKIEGDIKKLHAAMTKHYAGHGFGADLDKVFQSKVEPMLESLDNSLTDKLNEVAKATDSAQQAKLVAEAQKLIDQYESFVDSNDTFKALDKNPFVDIKIAATTKGALGKLRNSLAAAA